MAEPMGAIVLVLALGFCVPFWLMIFIATYVHFPKMEKRKRILMGIESATALVLLVLALTFISLVILGFKLA